MHAASITIADWCILIAGLVLPFIFTVIAKADKGFDNAQPRPYLDRVQGARKRAYWSVQNGHETFPLFVAAVLLAERAGAAQAHVNLLAMSFIALRVVYSLMYIFDKPSLRSLVWVAATGCIVAIFLAAV